MARKAPVQPPKPVSADLAVEAWPITKVKPYPTNPRKNAGKPVEKVAASLREFGWRQPIVVDEDGVIIVGHTRFLAALHLQMKQVPVHVARGLSPEKAKAYRIADNRSAQEAEWDFTLLADELKGLQAFGMDLKFTGWEEFELAPLLAAESWMPPESNSAEHGHRTVVSFSEKEFAVIERAAKLISDATVPQALVAICNMYIQRQKGAA